MPTSKFPRYLSIWVFFIDIWVFSNDFRTAIVTPLRDIKVNIVKTKEKAVIFKKRKLYFLKKQIDIDNGKVK